MLLLILKMEHPRPNFVYFRSLQTIYRIKTVGKTRTQIVGVEGEHVDHLTDTTTMATQNSLIVSWGNYF